MASKLEIRKRLEKFAKDNNLELFDQRGSLSQRIDTLSRNGSACPCLPEKRPKCPCPQAIQECKDNGECFCRVLMAKDWRTKVYKHTISPK